MAERKHPRRNEKVGGGTKKWAAECLAELMAEWRNEKRRSWLFHRMKNRQTTLRQQPARVSGISHLQMGQSTFATWRPWALRHARVGIDPELLTSHERSPQKAKNLVNREAATKARTGDSLWNLHARGRRGAIRASKAWELIRRAGGINPGIRRLGEGAFKKVI